MNFLGSTPHGTMPGGLLSRICLWHDAKLVVFASSGFIVGAAAQAALSESHTFYQSNRIGCWRSLPGEAAPAADSMRLSNFVFFLGLQSLAAGVIKKYSFWGAGLGSIGACGAIRVAS